MSCRKIDPGVNQTVNIRRYFSSIGEDQCADPGDEAEPDELFGVIAAEVHSFAVCEDRGKGGRRRL